MVCIGTLSERRVLAPVSSKLGKKSSTAARAVAPPRAMCARAGLRVEWVDVRVHQHVGEDEVLETLHAAADARLVVVLEGLPSTRARERE
eukprot:3632295-Pleurochrysis_carterae.AAC.1